MNKFIKYNIYWPLYRFYKLIKQSIKFTIQKIFRGYSDYEWYELYYCTAKWILPRLKHLYKYGIVDLNSYINHEETITYKYFYEELIWAFDSIIKLEKEMNFEDTFSKEDWKRLDKALEMFGKYFRNLWD